ncbi:MAG: hypothetical protein IKG42_01750 [Clostridia bacterium]|nr:hypothetical protein [Clostridia bacterium]
MKKIAFLGSYDKLDMMIYLAKIMTVIGKRILIIDGTVMQKSKYTVPALDTMALSYITEFEGIDVAVGFKNSRNLFANLGVNSYEELKYDIVMYDIDTFPGYINFELQNTYKTYFVTAFDNYSLKRGLETLIGLDEPVKMTKILFSRNNLKEEDEYLDFLAKDYPVDWAKEKIYFPFDLGDQSVINENQRLARIKFKFLTSQYKDALAYLTEEILLDENVSSREIRNIIRKIEKGA